MSDRIARLLNAAAFTACLSSAGAVDGRAGECCSSCGAANSSLVFANDEPTGPGDCFLGCDIACLALGVAVGEPAGYCCLGCNIACSAVVAVVALGIAAAGVMLLADADDGVALLASRRCWRLRD